MNAWLEAFDAKIAEQMEEAIPHPPKEVFKRLRVYLLKEAEQQNHQTQQHEVSGLLKQQQDHNRFIIFLGPAFDKEPSALKPFVLGSGGSLSFGLVLKDSNGGSILEAAFFHFRSKKAQVIRYDITPKPRDLLDDPRAHYHWADDLRLPAPVLHPLHILEVLFRVVDPQLK